MKIFKNKKEEEDSRKILLAALKKIKNEILDKKDEPVGGIYLTMYKKGKDGKYAVSVKGGFEDEEDFAKVMLEAFDCFMRKTADKLKAESKHRFLRHLFGIMQKRWDVGVKHIDDKEDFLANLFEKKNEKENQENNNEKVEKILEETKMGEDKSLDEDLNKQLKNALTGVAGRAIHNIGGEALDKEPTN